MDREPQPVYSLVYSVSILRLMVLSVMMPIIKVVFRIVQYQSSSDIESRPCRYFDDRLIWSWLELNRVKMSKNWGIPCWQGATIKLIRVEPNSYLPSVVIIVICPM